MKDPRHWCDEILIENGVGLMIVSIAGYFSLRIFCNVDRYISNYYMKIIILVTFYRWYLYSFPLSNELYKQQSWLVTLWIYVQAKFPLYSLLIGDIIAVYIVYSILSITADILRKTRYVSKKMIINAVGHYIVHVAKKLPFISAKISQEMVKIEADIATSLKSIERIAMGQIFELPEKGMQDDVLIARLKELAGESDLKWKDGLVSGAVYHGESAHLAVLNQAYALFSVSNPLHADLWPAVNKFESEVISMTANLLNGGNSNVCGTLSSGGTESIFLATKTHREWYAQEFGVTKPEIIACVTAHAAIDKACEILGIKLIKVPMDPITYKIDCNAVKWNITSQTIMIYSSAPNYPHGMIDDISKLSQIAKQNGVGLHVDCCLGGFVLPFVQKLYPGSLPAFNFELPGVTSMSCDTHKYGYAAKGTSVVLYRSKEIRRYQYFAYPDWTGGLYVTPTLAGSRAGALGAAAWASMMRLGSEGYMKLTKGIMETAKEIASGIREIDDIELVGVPQAMVVCFKSPTFNVLRISDAMTKKGWSLNSLQHPACVHICVTVRHIGKAQKFLTALSEAVAAIRMDPNGKLEGGSAIYGMASSMPAGPVDDILRIYTDLTLAV